MSILLNVSAYNSYSIFLMVHIKSPEFGERPSVVPKKNNHYHDLEQVFDIPSIILHY